MMLGTIERPIVLARTGTFQNLSDLKRKLVAGGYESVDAHISGAAIKRQRTSVMKAARV